MTLMSQRTCVANEIVQPVGNVVQDNLTIVVFQNGCSVMAKTIVATIATSYQRIVQNANLIQTLSVEIIDAYQSELKKQNHLQVTK